MAFDTKLNNLIVKAFQSEFEKNLPVQVKFGKIAKTDWKTNIAIGDEVDLILPGSVTLSSMTDPSNLGTAEHISNTTVKIRVTTGKSIFFQFDKKKSKQINAAAGDAAMLSKLIKEYTQDARDQYAAAIDSAYGALYAKAGYTLNGGNSTTALAYTSATIFQMFTTMAKKFKRGTSVKGIYRSAWKDGKMIAYIPPEAEDIIVASERRIFTESGAKKYESGYIGQMAGWDVLVNNQIAEHNSGYECLFGIENESLGGIIEKDIEIIHNIADASLNDSYKGGSVFGVDAARVDKFGAAFASFAY